NSFKVAPAWPESTAGRTAASFCPSWAQQTKALPGTSGKDAGCTSSKIAWCSKPEGKDILSLSRLIRCQKLAGRTADDVVLTLKILFGALTPAKPEPNNSNFFLTFKYVLTTRDLLTSDFSRAFRRSRNAAGGGGRSVDKAAKPNVHHQTNRQENKQRGGASVAHQRQRNAGDGHRANHHRHVNQHMEPQRCGNAHDQKHSRAILRVLSILH